MATAECPMDGCGFEGPVKSLEAHITGATSGDHAGKLGRNYRQDLVEQVEQRMNGATEGADTPLGLSFWQWVVVLGVALAILWWAAKDSGGSEPGSESRSEDEEEEPADDVEEEAGLI